MRLPGIYPPQHDTDLLIRALQTSGLASARRVLDMCTGTGAVAVAAAALGASSVTAVDLSHRAVVNAWANSLLRRADVDVRRGDLFAPIAGETFDVLVCNPPYVPAPSERLPRHRRGRSWDGGRDGRTLVDRVCRGAAAVLRPGGTVLLTHTAVIDADRTLDLFSAEGFDTRVVATQQIPFGPVMRARTEVLAARGLIRLDERAEEIIVIAASLAEPAAVAPLDPAQAAPWPAAPAADARLAG